MSNSLQSHGLKQVRLFFPPLSPGVCSNSCPLSQWCYLTISSSASPFSFCLQSFPASGYFPNSLENIGVSASALVLPMNIQGWFPLGRTDLISLQSKGLSSVFCSNTIWKHQFFGTQPSLWPKVLNKYVLTSLKEVNLSGTNFPPGDNNTEFGLSQSHSYHVDM